METTKCQWSSSETEVIFPTAKPHIVYSYLLNILLVMWSVYTWAIFTFHLQKLLHGRIDCSANICHLSTRCIFPCAKDCGSDRARKARRPWQDAEGHAGCFFLHLDFVEIHTALFWHTKEYGDWNADPGEREEDHKEESKPWVTAAKRETI